MVLHELVSGQNDPSSSIRNRHLPGQVGWLAESRRAHLRVRPSVLNAPVHQQAFLTDFPRQYVGHPCQSTTGLGSKDNLDFHSGMADILLVHHCQIHVMASL